MVLELRRGSPQSSRYNIRAKIEQDLLYHKLHGDDRPRGKCRGDGIVRETRSALPSCQNAPSHVRLARRQATGVGRAAPLRPSTIVIGLVGGFDTIFVFWRFT
jgi:hypothetical protein